MVANKTFIAITNKDIYSKLCDIENHVIKTNGKVRMNTLRSALSFSLSVASIIALVGVIVALA